jgi:hypothetical protein
VEKKKRQMNSIGAVEANAAKSVSEKTLVNITGKI